MPYYYSDSHVYGFWSDAQVTLELNNLFLSGAGQFLYLGLSTNTLVQHSGQLTEVTGGGYARIAIERIGANWALSGRVIQNAVQFQFPTPTGDWLSGGSLAWIRSWFMSTSPSSTALNNIVLSGNLPRFYQVTTGQPFPVIPAGCFVIAR